MRAREFIGVRARYPCRNFTIAIPILVFYCKSHTLAFDFQILLLICVLTENGLLIVIQVRVCSLNVELVHLVVKGKLIDVLVI